MELREAPFSFRDYIAYFFPGTIVIAALCVRKPSMCGWFEANKLVAGTIILVGGYVLGSLCQCISFGLLLGMLHKICGHPWDVLSGRKYATVWRFSASQAESIRTLLIRYWGDKFDVVLSDPMLLHLCWRDIQHRGHPGLDYVGRCLSFYNYYAAMIPALLLLIVLIFMGRIAELLVVFASLPLCVRGYYSFAAQFAGNIYMIFYVIHINKLSENRD